VHDKAQELAPGIPRVRFYDMSSVIYAKYQELLKELSFIVFKRADTNEELFYSYVEKLSQKGMNITVMDEIIPTVSSTEIRNDFKKAKNLLPQKILEFLTEKRVYID
jgi:nicotinic acid mononucleotide adenylyltransferase